MPFRLEADLCGPITGWLHDAGFAVRAEVSILGRRADLVGLRGTNVTAIEMKLDRWAEALRQAIAYQLAADRVWVAMPLAAAFRPYRERWMFEAQGVGLLAVDDRGRVRSPIPAAPSPRLLPFLREKVLDGWSDSRSLREPLSSEVLLGRWARSDSHREAALDDSSRHRFVEDSWSSFEPSHSKPVAEPSYAYATSALRGAQKG